MKEQEGRERQELGTVWSWVRPHVFLLFHGFFWIYSNIDVTEESYS